MQTFVRVFGSLWMTIPILLAIAVILIMGTVGFGGIGLDLSVGAIRKDWYRAWWFQGLLGLLAVNLITCTIKRKPWQIWQWGFITTHWGILMIITGSMVSGLYKIYGMMPVAKGGSSDTVQLEDERELEIRWLDTGKVETIPIDYNWYMDQRAGHRHRLDGATLLVKQYRWNVQRMEATGRPFVEFEIEAMGEKTRAAVSLGSLEEVGPLSLAFVEMSEEELKAHLSPEKRQGVIHLAFGETLVSVDVAPNLGSEIEKEGHKIKLEALAPDALGVLATVDGERYLVLSQGIVFADTKRVREPTPIEGEWRPPIFTGSRFVAVKTPSGWRRVASSSKGAVDSGELEFGATVPFPSGMPLQIRALRYIERPGIAEVKSVPAEQNVPLHPAILLHFEEKGDVDVSWLLFTEDPEFDQSREFVVGGRRLRATFRPALYRSMGMTLKLLDATRDNHPGSQDPMKFESTIEITDHKTGRVHVAQVRVNEPVTVRGYSFYMSQFDPGKDGRPPKATFQVLYDPGTLIIYLGAIIAVSGTIFMFYLKPMILKARGELQRDGVELRGPGFLHYLAAIPVPISVIIAACLRNGHPRIVYPFGRAIAATWILVTAALACYLGIWVI